MKKILCLLVAAVLSACSSDSSSGPSSDAGGSSCKDLSKSLLPQPEGFQTIFTTDLQWVDQGNDVCITHIPYSSLQVKINDYYQYLKSWYFDELTADKIPADELIGKNSEKYMYRKYYGDNYTVIFHMWLTPNETGYDFNAVFSKRSGTSLGSSSTVGSSTTVTGAKDIVKYYFTGILSSNYINNKIVYNKMEASASDASIDGMDVVSMDFESLQSKLLMKGWTFNHSNDGKGCEYKTLGGTNSSYANAPSGTYTCGIIDNARFTYSGYSCEAKVTYVTDSRAFRHGIILNYVTCSKK